ncbi:MAG: M15 family metallopeptidase [Lachnospiraceae bacterium]|nr:M15 family metallopeptidase [Lachnospiraceae bacterium]MEE3461514.1 M15 family metallopeptidase [Lachnospiraceae bacterium]
MKRILIIVGILIFTAALSLTGVNAEAEYNYKPKKAKIEQVNINEEGNICVSGKDKNVDGYQIFIDNGDGFIKRGKIDYWEDYGFNPYTWGEISVYHDETSDAEKHNDDFYNDDADEDSGMKLKNGQNIFIKIRAYNYNAKDKKIFGPDSEPYALTYKYASDNKSGKTYLDYSRYDKEIRVTIPYQEGACGYTLYRSEGNIYSYKAVSASAYYYSKSQGFNNDDSTYYDKDIKKKQLYFYKVRYFYVTDKEKAAMAAGKDLEYEAADGVIKVYGLNDYDEDKYYRPTSTAPSENTPADSPQSVSTVTPQTTAAYLPVSAASPSAVNSVTAAPSSIPAVSPSATPSVTEAPSPIPTVTPASTPSVTLTPGALERKTSEIDMGGLFTMDKSVSIKSIRAAGKHKLKIRWGRISGIDGYTLYRLECGKNVKIADISPDKTSYTLKKQTAGSVYGYYISAYVNYMGEKLELGSPSYYNYTTGVMNYYLSCNSSDYWSKSGGKVNIDDYKSYTEAAKHMKTIKIKTWSLFNGRKITRTWNLTVQKAAAPTVAQAFKEIYNGREKFPINSIGAYSPRHGYHGRGLAIDINPNENYQVRNNKALVGSFYKPGVSQLSIPPHCEAAQILTKYGFYQLYGSKSNYADYMHFSYPSGD